MDEFGLHELLDRTDNVNNIIEILLINHHDFSSLPEDLQNKILKVSEDLGDIYQEIGRLRYAVNTAN